MISSLDGSLLVRDSIEGDVYGDSEKLGIDLAERLLVQGCAKILDEVRKANDKNESSHNTSKIASDRIRPIS